MKPIQVRVRRGLEIQTADLPDAVLIALEQAFTFDNPTYKRLQRMEKFLGDTPKYIQNYALGDETILLPRGATRQLKQLLEKHGMRPAYRDDRLRLPPEGFPFKEGAEPVTLRPDQEELLHVAMTRENALIRAGTGSGKTEVGLEMVRRLEQPALVIVWSSGLMRQWVDRICRRWGWGPKEVGLWGGGKKIIKPITIAMQQSLYQGSSKLEEAFGVVICDEVQRFAARTFQDVINRFPARYRLGISADERRKDRLDVLIRNTFGEVAAEVTREELVAKGRVCEVEIYIVPTDFRWEVLEEVSPKERPGIISQRWTELVGLLAGSIDRNRTIARLAARLAKAGKSILVFTDRVPHAYELSRLISIEQGVPCGTMVGGRENRAAYDEAKARLSSGELKVAVGTSATYQAEDIPRLQAGIVATPTATNRQLLEQQVGRLRRLFPGKLKGELYYIWDSDLFPRHPDQLRRWYGSRLVHLL